MAKNKGNKEIYKYYVKRRGADKYVSEIEVYHGSSLTSETTDFSKALLFNDKDEAFDLAEELTKRMYNVRWCVGKVRVEGESIIDMDYQATKDDIIDIVNKFNPNRETDNLSLNEIAKFVCCQKICNDVLRIKGYKQNRILGKIYAKLKGYNSGIEMPSIALSSARLLCDILSMNDCISLMDYTETELENATNRYICSYKLEI